MCSLQEGEITKRWLPLLEKILSRSRVCSQEWRWKAAARCATVSGSVAAWCTVVSGSREPSGAAAFCIDCCMVHCRGTCFQLSWICSMRLLHDVLLGNNFLTGCRGQVCMESMVIVIVSRLIFWFFWFTLNTNHLKNEAKSIQIRLRKKGKGHSNLDHICSK